MAVAAENRMQGGVQNVQRYTKPYAQPYKAYGQRRRAAKDNPEDNRETVRRATSRVRQYHRAILENAGARGGGAARVMKKARAVRASYIIGAFVLPFYLAQLWFGIISLASAGVEWTGETILWGLGAAIVPTEKLFLAAYVITTVIAVLLMGAAAFMYTVNRVRWWEGGALVKFFFFLALCFVPLLNIVPWLACWMVSVVYAQK